MEVEALCSGALVLLRVEDNFNTLKGQPMAVYHKILDKDVLPWAIALIMFVESPNLNPTEIL